MKQGIKGENYSLEKEKYDSRFYIQKYQKIKKAYLLKLTLKRLFYSRSVCFFFLQHLVIHLSTSQAATILNPLLCTVLLLCSSPVLC